MSMEEQDSNRIIENLLDDRIRALSANRDSDFLTYLGPVGWGMDEEIKLAVEEIESRRAALSVVLETTGGYVEVAESIARIFRHHYDRIDFIIPTFAMSAGTILAMSGNHILMDYSSVLGPIDPQVQKPGTETFVPALGYVAQYEKLIKKSSNGELTTAELAYFVERFDAAELYRYDQEKQLSEALLVDWLVQYKFKDWDVTETRKIAVTDEMREQRAAEVAGMLNNTERWHTRSRGIPMEVLRRELKLRIDDFGGDIELAAAMKDYFLLLRDYARRRGHFSMVLHTAGSYVGV